MPPRWSLLVAVALLAGRCYSARILAVVPTPSVSHQLPFRAVAMALVARGHHVTIVTTNPIENPPENYTQIDLSFSYEMTNEVQKSRVMDEMSPPEFLRQFTEFMEKLTDLQLQSPPVLKLIEDLKSGRRFDAFVLETVMYQAWFGLAHLAGSPPLVGYTSLGMTPAGHDAVANYDNPAYSPTLAADFTDGMAFWQRALNALAKLVYLYLHHNYMLPAQELLLRKHFGDGPPPVAEADRNMSLMLVNNHFSTNYPRPYVPAVVELAGLHIQRERSPLPKEMLEFLEGATNGAVYFSLGSNVRSSLLGDHKVQMICEAFSRLPQRVLWKWEDGDPPTKPDNVFISKWFPQQDLLAHEKIVVFVTQGGLQSLHEAAYFAVPLVGIPFLGDQQHNVAKAASVGIAYRLDVGQISAEALADAISTVANNISYKENMLKFSAVYREHQETSVDEAVWWLEYIMRHEGAPHLRSPALNMKWWEVYLLDVLGVVISVLIATFVIIYFIAYKSIVTVIGWRK